MSAFSSLSEFWQTMLPFIMLVEIVLEIGLFMYQLLRSNKPVRSLLSLAVMAVMIPLLFSVSQADPDNIEDAFLLGAPWLIFAAAIFLAAVHFAIALPREYRRKKNELSPFSIKEATDKLYANNTADLTVLSNPNAYYSIALDADHQHDYTGQPYLYLDPGNHYQECTAGDGYNIQPHAFTPWTDNGNGTHSRHCTVCKMTDGSTYTETAEHTWVWVVDQEAALGQPGKQHEECTGCHAKRSENTEIPALRDYAVTVTGGTATVAAGTPITRAMEGVEVTITAQAPDGTHFVKWVVKAGGVTLANETSATTTFIMPANDVTIEAECAENPVEAYTLTVINGTAYVAAGTPITDKIAQNTVVTVKADAPETGKVFDKWVVLEGNVTLTDATKATTTFTMPGNAVKIEATYKDAPPSHTHSYGTDWKYDDTNHWHECECGDKADTAAHNFQWVIDKAATKEATGIKHEECTVCGAKRSENTVIDKLPDGGNTGNTGSGDNNTDKPGKDDSTKSPQAGDSSNLIGWLAALFVSGGVLTVLGASGKKRKESDAD